MADASGLTATLLPSQFIPRRCGLEFDSPCRWPLFSELKLSVRTGAREFLVCAEVVACDPVDCGMWRVAVFFLQIASRPSQIQWLVA